MLRALLMLVVSAWNVEAFAVNPVFARPVGLTRAAQPALSLEAVADPTTLDTIGNMLSALPIPGFVGYEGYNSAFSGGGNNINQGDVNTILALAVIFPTVVTIGLYWDRD